MRVVLLIVGALIGSAFALSSTGLFGAVLGAFIGFTLAEVVATRTRLSELERELTDLKKAAALRRTAAEKPAAPEPARTEEPGPQSVARAYYDSAPQPRPTPGLTSWSPSVDEGADGEVASHGAGAGRDAAVDSTESQGTAPESPRSAPPQAAARSPGEPVRANAATASRPKPPEELALFKLIREYFTTGNTVVRVGVIILFIGVAFLLRYVAEHTNVPIEVRLSGVAAGAVVLLFIGWRLRKSRPDFALAVQGGAMGILYLTVFASLRLFHVLPPGPAFAVLVLLAAFSAALAILQDSLALALLAIGCGFLAPVLASSGQGNHVVLFSYYTVLNLGILAIAWFKAWRPLNVVGFLFTFVIGTVWGVLKYRTNLFATTEPFLIGFFLLYVAVAILFSVRQRPALRGYVDGTIVFGVPVVAFGLQAAMVHKWPFAMAYSALAVSAMYLVLAWLLHRGQRETQRMLVESFMALGILFLTLAVPLALDGRWSAATWSFEGAALVWVGCRQNRKLPRAFGTLLQIASGIVFFYDFNSPYSDVPVLNSAYLGGVMIAAASVFAARALQKAHEDLRDFERTYLPVLFFWGLLWWVFSGVSEIVRHVPEDFEPASILVFLTATALLSREVHRRLGISVARLPPLALLPVMVMTAVLWGLDLTHPFSEAGWAAWLIAFAAFYFLCRRSEDTDPVWASKPMHAVSALLLIVLLSWELSWQVDNAVNGGGSWPAIAWVLVPAIALYIMPKLVTRLPWPVGKHEESYVAVVGVVLAMYLVVWSLATNITMPGNPYPLPFVPLLNPLDLAEAFVLLVLVRYGLHLHKTKYPALGHIQLKQLTWLLAGLAFVWLNAVLLRTLHHWAAIPYELEPLFRSTLVQTAITIFWTVLALATMLFGTRKSLRLVWIVGAALLGIVVVKLGLIDLSRIGTLERIVSFVGVGLLMLVVGYFSPVPPRKEAV